MSGPRGAIRTQRRRSHALSPPLPPPSPRPPPLRTPTVAGSCNVVGETRRVPRRLEMGRRRSSLLPSLLSFFLALLETKEMDRKHAKTTCISNFVLQTCLRGPSP